MNTPISFEIAKLLKEKGYDESCNRWYHDMGMLGIPSMSIQEFNDGGLPAPTIADVLMWLYEKHEYWCYSYTNGKIWYPCIQHKFGDMAILSGKIGTFNSPTEAYEAAINYTLNNLI